MARFQILNKQEKDISKYKKIIRDVGKQVLKEHKIKDRFEISVVITNDEEIRQINREFRNIDSSTDVLSFPQFQFDEVGKIILLPTDSLLLGDVVISLEHAERQALEFGHSSEREVGYLMCHSMLHLLGYDHIKENDKKIMRAKEEKIMKEIGLTRE